MNEDMIKEFLRTVEDNTGFDLEQEPGSSFTTAELTELVITGVFDAIATKLGNELKSAIEENENQVNCENDYFSFIAEVRGGKEDDNISVTIIPNETFTEDLI